MIAFPDFPRKHVAKSAAVLKFVLRKSYVINSGTMPQSIKNSLRNVIIPFYKHKHIKISILYLKMRHFIVFSSKTKML